MKPRHHPAPVKDQPSSLEMILRGPQDIALRDRRVVELALPAHMLYLMLEQVAKQGVEMREDLRHRVNLAAMTPLQKLDDLSISRVAKRIDDAATSLLRLLKATDARQSLYQVAMFALVLVDEGHFADKTNMAVLVALLLLEDVKDDKPDANGFNPIAAANEEGWRKAARDILRNAQLLGLYVKAEQLVAPPT